ncbi:hypothetical protein [Synechococcus sp. MIT S9509]|uniref:hypothetical protein n=1 Tax=unclassified Synechococcus TaxID=2626047 RepID=UPI0039B002B4
MPLASKLNKKHSESTHQVNSIVHKKQPTRPYHQARDSSQQQVLEQEKSHTTTLKINHEINQLIPSDLLQIMKMVVCYVCFLSPIPPWHCQGSRSQWAASLPFQCWAA